MREVLTTLFDEVRRGWPFRWFGWLIAVVISAVGALTTLVLPDIYTSSTQIALTQDDDSAAPVYNAQIRFLNDNTLEAVLDQVDMGVDLSSPAARQRARDALRLRIVLEGTGTETFAIRCNDRSPKRAKAVCDVLLEAFKTTVANNANTSYLEQQLVQLQLELGAAEKRLQEFRVAHLDIFGQGGIETRLDAAQAAQEKAASDYDLAVRRRDEFQNVWRASRTNPNVAASTSLAAPTGDPLIDRLYTAWAELEGLRTRFSESHPDVVLARRQIETIVRQYPPDVRMCGRGDGSADTASSSAVVQSTEYLQIDRQTIDASAANIAVCRALATLVLAENEVESLRALSASAPPIQAELLRLTAERDAARDRVENTRARIQEFGAGDPTSLYTVVSEPALPRLPSSPNRPLWLAVVLLAGVAGGAGAAYGRGLIGGAFVGPAGLRSAYTLPFYGAISLVNGLRSRLDQSTQVITFGLAVGALIVAMLLLILVDPYISIARNWAVGMSMSIKQLIGMIR